MCKKTLILHKLIQIEHKIPIIIVLFLLLSSQVFSSLLPPMPEPRTMEESLFVRRVVELWRERDFKLAYSQIKTYMDSDPHTPYADHFYAMLGCISLHNKEFSEALVFFESIQSQNIKEHIQLKKWQALYQMKLYWQLYQEIAYCQTPSEQLEDETHFYFAEAAFREALSLMQFPEGKEQGLELLHHAIEHYHSIEKSPLFGSHAKLGLAEIYRYLNEPKKAEVLYLELAEKSQNNEVLLHTASVVQQFDKVLAKQIFEKLAKENFSEEETACYQWLLLLAEGGEWDTLLKERDLFLKKLQNERLSICYFYLGQIAFEKRNFEQAAADLQNCLNQKLAPNLEKKALYLYLMSARALKKWEICESCLEEIEIRFPEERQEAYCMLAQGYQKEGFPDRALRLYEKSITEKPQSEFAERALLEIVYLLANQKKFSEARQKLFFLFDSTSPEKQFELHRIAIDLSLKEENFQQLVADLERALKTDLFFGDEKRDKELLLAKAYLKINNSHSALQLLNRMENPDPLLITMCYVMENGEPEKIITFGEHALELYPDEKKLHLHLFNAYLELAKEKQEKEYEQIAAKHLYEAVNLFPISIENQLWLAHFLANDSPKKAMTLLEQLIETEANCKKFDTEAVLLADLYIANGWQDKGELLLKKISSFKENTEFDAKLKLAKIYEATNRLEEAQELFTHLETISQLGIAYEAQLHLARMEFIHAPEVALQKLHDLAMHKTLQNEPVHLEAALDYAELKATLYPKDEQSERLLTFFTEVKNAFSKQDDIWSKDYHASREVFSDKEIIYQAYMRYLEARIYLLQSVLSHDPLDSKTKLNAARALLTTLRHGRYAVSNYIKEKSSCCISEL